VDAAMKPHSFSRGRAKSGTGPALPGGIKALSMWRHRRPPLLWRRNPGHGPGVFTSCHPKSNGREKATFYGKCRKDATRNDWTRNNTVENHRPGITGIFRRETGIFHRPASSTAKNPDPVGRSFVHVAACRRLLFAGVEALSAFPGSRICACHEPFGPEA